MVARSDTAPLHTAGFAGARFAGSGSFYAWRFS
jgi:hypothetical protein